MGEKFTWETLKDYINIDEHIDFAASLIRKYQWEDEVRKSLNAQLDQIRAKQDDKALNLSVIGEFSTGKSSFINALIGHPLLVSSVVQGTTVINTIIEHSDGHSICVNYKDGHEDTYKYKDVTELSSALSTLTTDATTAKTIKTIRVMLPSAFLSQGIRIIDTPGTNSLESWHEDVTREALRDLSDLSIILTDASRQMPQTLTTFIADNLSDILDQCAFVATYYDALRRRERASVVDYIKVKIRNEFGIDNPLVLPYVAPAVIAYNQGEGSEAQAEFVEISRNSEELLLKHMAQRRTIAQIKKVLALTTEILSLLENNIEERRQSSNEQLEILNRSKQADLSVFINEQKQKAIRHYQLSTHDLRQKLGADVYHEAVDSKRKMVLNVRDCTAKTAEKIKEYLEKTFPEECETEAEKINTLAANMFQHQVKSYTNVIEDFQKQFTTQFDKLGILKIDFESNVSVVPASSKVDRNNLRKALTDVVEQAKKENIAFLGGAAAGAVAGTMVMPVIGTALGALVGFMAGGMLAPDVAKIKKDMSEKLTTRLETYFTRIGGESMNVFDRNSETLEQAISNEIDRYLTTYKATIDARIAEHKAKEQALQKEIDLVNEDLRLIKLHKEDLTSTSTRVKLISKLTNC